MINSQYLLLGLLLTTCYSQYILVQNLTDISTNTSINQITINANLDRLYVKMGTSGFQVYNFIAGRYKINQIKLEDIAYSENIVPTSNGQALTIGTSLYSLNSTIDEYFFLQKLPGNISKTVISGDGQVIVGIQPLTLVQILTRSDIPIFTSYQNITFLQNILGVAVSENGSLIAAISSDTIYVYRNTLGTYKIVDMFPNSLPLTTSISRIIAVPDFSAIIAYNYNYTINVFRYTADEYRLNQSLTIPTINDTLRSLTFDKQTMAIRTGLGYIRIYEFNNVRYESAQNISLAGSIQATVKNGTMVCASNTSGYVWRRNQSL